MDLIRSGKAPEVIRRKGAEGSLPLPLPDKIEILTSLAAAPEADLREKALETLRAWDRLELRRIMASPQTAPDVLRFAAEQLLAGREELREILLWNPSLPPEVQKSAASKTRSQRFGCRGGGAADYHQKRSSVAPEARRRTPR